MSLEKIVSVHGMGGLYRVIAQTRSGGLVIESLTDQKRSSVEPNLHPVSNLDAISVYTVEGDIPLEKVFFEMKSHDADISKLDLKRDPAELKKELKKIINLDDDRVRGSDVKKMLSWYSLLKGIVEFEEPKKQETEATPEAKNTEEEIPSKPKSTHAKKKAESTEKEEAEKPAPKKRAAKKSAS